MKHLSKEFRHYLEENLGITAQEISLATANELFDEILTREGHGQYAGHAIRFWVSEIYDCDLNDLSLGIFLQDQRGK